MSRAITKPDLSGLVRKWQPILRLQDWSIKIQYARIFDIKADSQGSCSWVINKKSALIKILEPQDYPTDIKWPQDIEKTVVHELLHLHTAPFDKTEGLAETMLEQAIECVSDALVVLDRK